MPISRRVHCCGACLALLCGLLSYFLAAAQTGDKPQDVPKSEKARTAKGGRETLAGILMRAELRPTAEITQLFPPSTRAGQGRNERVFAEPNTVLLILRFSVRPSQCVPLDRQRLLVRDGEGKSYPYGGWRVEQGEYGYCAALPAMIQIGPWNNTLWTPVAIRPLFGFLDLVFQLDAKATKLVFTDGVNEIELDPLLKVPEKRK